MLKHKQTGFTIVELVMVIVILGILSATALPKFFDENTFSEHAFFDDTLNSVRYTQKLAVATGCSVQISIAANSYSINRGTTCTSSVYSLDVPHPSSGASDFTGSESGVNVSSTSSPIIFYALGNASTDATITVVGKSISVVAKTGFVYAL